ncbi:MAG: DSD1 family PLP-dependent enzyme [Dehalococcoidia bacterium]|jgi:3-hydroxy-D-aspartate aldolase
MNKSKKLTGLEVGYDLPALPGMSAVEIQTPCLVLDLDALERNIVKMGKLMEEMGVRHRVHGKMHRSVDVAKLQEKLGNACGICCQKVAEAEVFARGGIKDILVTYEIRDLAKIDRLARIPKFGTRTIVIVDDVANVADLSAAVQKHGTKLECLVEIDCGSSLAGVSTIPEVVEIAKAIDAAPGLKFSGIQAYQGAAQHLRKYEDRKALIDVAVAIARDAVEALKKEGLTCDIVGGAGSGTYYFEGNSGVYNELQCGSYAFMDHDYGLDLDKDGKRIDEGEWENALFILTMVISHKKPNLAICDAGLKVQSLDSGLPVFFDRTDLTYLAAADEHGLIIDPNGALKVGDKLRLVPGHCDPTCNVHDWYVGVRNEKVEVVWPVSARGKSL